MAQEPTPSPNTKDEPNNSVSSKSSSQSEVSAPGADQQTAEPAKRHKNIILFSDGTGNSSGKLFKTNVWRMYEAVDLGPSATGKRDQVAYYDNGVGTSGFKPLAFLGGIFGIGLKRNVLDIYRFACRNYRPAKGQEPGQDTTDEGDHIYGFGFSRGAFTMRLLIALIAEQGLIPYTSELELKQKSAEAYRLFRSTGKPRYWWSPWRLVRWPFSMIGHGWRKLRGIRHDPAANFRPVIRFVGVWDTVAAYGGPIIELTRAFDNWILRLSMPDHKLHERVQKARHALALDDERDSFHPLLWDEVHERDLIELKKQRPNDYGSWITADRLEQVWFCGMHSDVGGGYPDESLSYVSLLWMFDEAKKHGLRPIESILDRYLALANSFGPIHNSRAGIAAYYRYQPRNISAWLDPVDNATLSLRDPTIRTKTGPTGLLLDVKIHESVIARTASGTDRYAPFALPSNFKIHPPGPHGENQPLADDQEPVATGEPLSRRTLVNPEIRQRLADPTRQQWVKSSMDAVWDMVWFRRWTYFATLLVTLLLVFMPFWIAWAPEPPLFTDGRTWIGSLIGLLRLILPNFLGGWVRVYEHNSFYFLLLAVLIGFLLWASTRLELNLRDQARRVWEQAFEPAVPKTPRMVGPSTWQRLRTNRAYQRGLQIFKWHVMPFFIGLIMLGLAGWAALGVYTQTRLPGLENGTELCSGPLSGKQIIVVARDFSTKQVCNPVNARVSKGITYDISFHVVDDWLDGDVAASPEGLSVSQLGVAGYLGLPLKRVIKANYLMPTVVVRPTSKDQSSLRKPYMYPLKLERVGDATNLYRGKFTATRSGELYLFANDAALPFTGRWYGTSNVAHFYGNNGGTACVIIARAGSDSDRPLNTKTPICKLAAERARELEKAKAVAGTRHGIIIQ